MQQQLYQEVLSRIGTDHHTASFNHLVHCQIRDIIALNGTASTVYKNNTYILRLCNTTVCATPTSASQCYRLGLNLTCEVQADIQLHINDQVSQQLRMTVAHIPMMTGRNTLTKDFPDDMLEPCAGFFITKGKCRTIPPTKTLLYNIPVFTRRGDVTTLQLRSSHHQKIFRATSTIEFTLNRVGCIRCKLPFHNTPFSLRVIILSLGTTIQEFINTCHRLLPPATIPAFRLLELDLEQNNVDEIYTEMEAILYISQMFGKKLESTGRNIIQNELFPHLEDSRKHYTAADTMMIKWHFLALCITQLFLYTGGHLATHDRDDYRLAQVITTANHLGSLFRLLFIAHMSTCVKLMRRMIQTTDKPNIVKLYGEQRLTTRIMSALATGVWSIHRKGVSLALNSTNQDAIDSQLRRISSSLCTTDGTHTTARSVTPEQYGFICAASTPDGEGTGLIYELALTASVTPPVTDLPQRITQLELILSTWLIPNNHWLSGQYNNCNSRSDGRPYCFHNPYGAWTHIVFDVMGLVQAFRGYRRSGQLPYTMFIDVDHAAHTVHIMYQEGILYRALLVVDQLSLLATRADMSLDEALSCGVIEYVSPREQASLCRLALDTASITDQWGTCTHCELTQASFLGVMASSVPFATGQQGPRLAYFTSQKKQVITGPHKPYRGEVYRHDSWYCHRPLVYTLSDQLANRNGSGDYGGTPVVLALMALPRNQEDAIVIKKGTLDRGCFTSSSTRVYISEINNTNSTNKLYDRFESPDQVIAKKNTSYTHLGTDGLPTKGTYLPGGSVIIGKTRHVQRTAVHKTTDDSASVTRCDISVLSRGDESGVVSAIDKIDMNGGTRVSVMVTSTHIPQVGDKFTSHYSQKGVVGAIWSDEDMPFSLNTGVSPDIIVSPLSMTSRMTMSALLSLLVGKTVVVDGDVSLGLDEQHYNQSNKTLHDRLETILLQHGFAKDGTELFADGRTGELIPTRIFVGVVDYFRLVHIASKKIHARSTGPLDPLTRQPKDGRRSGGGLRLGEMESSALVAHGSAHTLQERLRELSDVFDVYICRDCGIMSDYVSNEMDFAYCGICNSTDSVRMVRVPFTFLILVLELLATGISMKFTLRDTVNNVYTPVTND